MTQMDSVTQQNASLVEQTGAASLEDQAKHLAELIATFRTAEKTTARQPSSVSASASKQALQVPVAKKAVAKVEKATTEEWSEF
ncbi:hypothetical protein DFO67_1312 [Modicisalibacter xianhensis]|uniref:Methyl-accepting chemotaxis protein n=1 Tax=Modicisalibacter xianhensis TaxID=442341 RepID=A0A4R8F9E4_9GAMM|nr:hypothetical protein [Halomonas xianhensis]TDX22119.1 hypothetical protein DFO67_1312 [Halomonas xianhensis]